MEEDEYGVPIGDASDIVGFVIGILIVVVLSGLLLYHG